MRLERKRLVKQWGGPAFRYFVITEVYEFPRLLFAFARPVPRERDHLDVPFGWLRVRHPWNGRRFIMPLWVYLAVRMWWRRWYPFEVMERLGLWHVEDGDLYSSGRPSVPRPVARALWCFAHDADHCPPR